MVKTRPKTKISFVTIIIRIFIKYNDITPGHFKEFKLLEKNSHWRVWLQASPKRVLYEFALLDRGHRWAGQTLTGTWHKFPPSLEALLMFVHYNPWYATCPEHREHHCVIIEQMSSCSNEGKLSPSANTHTHDGQLNPNNDAKLSS